MVPSFCTVVLFTLIAVSYGRRSGSRILHGQNADITEHPFYGLIIPKYEMFLGWTSSQYLNVHCGASLVSPRFFVTANHCFMKDNNPDHWIVMMGVRDRCMYDGTTQIINVAGVFPHPDAKIADQVKYHDIALIQSDRDIYGIPYINLPMFGPQENEKGIVIGFGLTRIEIEFPSGNLKDLPCKLQKAFQFVPNQRECLTPKEDIKGAFCVMDMTNKNASACRGDSGGPYFTYRNNSATLLGVSSFSDSLCQPWTYSDHYTNVFLYVPWILSVISFPFPQSSSMVRAISQNLVPVPPPSSYPVQSTYLPALSPLINAMPVVRNHRFNALSPKLSSTPLPFPRHRVFRIHKHPHFLAGIWIPHAYRPKFLN